MFRFLHWVREAKKLLISSTEGKENDAWAWTDELILEFAVRSYLGKDRELTIEEFKELKSPHHQ